MNIPNPPTGPRAPSYRTVGQRIRNLAWGRPTGLHAPMFQSVGHRILKKDWDSTKAAVIRFPNSSDKNAYPYGFPCTHMAKVGVIL
jgi:hypothetical protein